MAESFPQINVKQFSLSFFFFFFYKLKLTILYMALPFLFLTRRFAVASSAGVTK